MDTCAALASRPARNNGGAVNDGNQISQTYHRSSLTPAQDLTGVPANVVAICNTVWTAECIAAYQAAQAAAEAARNQA